MPSISKLFRLISINKHLINNNLNDEYENQVGDSFLSSSIDVLSPPRMQSNDLLSPVSSRISIINPGTEEMEEEEEDDPIMYTAPISQDNENRISSMSHLIHDSKYRVGTPTPDIDNNQDISGDDQHSSDYGDGL